MKEFFVVSESFAAPWVSDRHYEYAKGNDARRVLLAYAREYSHPAGLYAADIHLSADSYHHGNKPLFRWICNHEVALREATKNLDCYSYLGHAPGKFEINGKMIVVQNPKAGGIEGGLKEYTYYETVYRNAAKSVTER
jgi:hypothetical protein